MYRAVHLLLILLVPFAARGADFAFQPGDHVSLVGNTLADRMQHDGWLEAYLQTRLPEHQLVVRNLGFSGDELNLRLRSMGFGSPDEWLTKTKTDVVLAFFGYGESFADEAGLEAFKKELAKFIDHTRDQKYNGESAPRLAVFSPIAHEKLDDPNFSDGVENNRRLALYTKAMREVCANRGVPFVDLFEPSRQQYEANAAPLTINGVHLNPLGNEVVGRIIADALAPAAKTDDPARVEVVRKAVADKDFYWYERYRIVDGYSIYGGRADLKFVGGQTNRDVMNRELEVLDVLTANRDPRIWALARGADYTVDDGNTPPFIPVETNKPGPLPGGKHVFLSGEESLEKMTVAEHMKVNVFASEKEFPELVNPVQMTWDPQGRLWVAVWPTYPHWKPKSPMNDKLLVLSDTDGDGRADKCETFADNLHCPTGFELYNGGVLIAQAPALVFLKDTDGDGRADSSIRLLDGLDSADTHHTSNSFVLDPAGGLYFQEGTFHHTQVESPYGPTVRCVNAGVFRYEPRTQRFDVYITHGFANPHGHVFDAWGQDIVVDGTGAQPYHSALFSGRLDFPEKHPTPPQVYQQRTRPCPGLEILASRHFPEEMQGNLLVPNVIGFQGILQYKLSDDGASLHGTEVEPILSSTDQNFRPSDVKVGPDGAIYFIDWHNPIIGHMQHNLRDPSRDVEHGRIYRVTYEGRPLLTPAKIAGEPIPKLLDLLKEPEDRTRYRARIELAGRPTAEVIRAAKDWAAKLDRADQNFEHHRLEALWLHQNHNVVDADLLAEVLASPDFRARSAAVRVLSYWRDRVSGSLEQLKALAADSHPRVRLEAVRAASFYRVPEAIEVALVASDHPTDKYIDFVRGETMKALAPYVSQAIAAGQPIRFTTEAGKRYFVKNVSTDNLAKLERTADVARELLSRPGVRDEHRLAGAETLAKQEKGTLAAVLLAAARDQVQQGTLQDESVLFDLLRLAGDRVDELRAERPELLALARQGKLPALRQLAFASLIAVDGSVEPSWDAAQSSADALYDLVAAVPLVRDPSQRAALYPRVEALLKELPPAISASSGKATPRGQFVRIELPGRQRTLTLAEVEVFSDGQNIAREGKASQRNTANGGEAARAIDGNKSGAWGAGGQTHSQENTPNPFWEVDLGSERPIESVIIYNRTDEGLGSRLNGFNLKVLDADRKTVFEASQIPAPEVRQEIAIGGASPERAIRRAALLALTSVRGQEAAAFQAIEPFLAGADDRESAVAALLRIPVAYWPAERARPVIDQMLAYVKSLPTESRTSDPALEALQLAEGMSTRLPADQARQARKEIGEVGVKLIRLGTVTDQMRFDKDTLVVQAGGPVEVIFENTDIMPHNFVVTEPGALAEVGNLAEMAATQPGAIERQFVPESKKILVASRLLPPRESQRVSFTAPSKPGVYPYVCTYPGHWRRMYGSLYVVDDLEGYLENPEAYVAANKLEPQDELLAFNRPRTEWKLAEFAEVAKLLPERSFTSGKQLFQVGNCVACHKIGDVGQELGPDLAKLDAKLTADDILRSILEPSHKIEDKYAQYAFELDSGLVVTGMILKETDDYVEVIENPLAKTEPRRLAKGEIESRTKADSSIMPKGLLDKFTRDEILDLLCYVNARADEKRAGKGGHHHGH